MSKERATRRAARETAAAARAEQRDRELARATRHDFRKAAIAKRLRRPATGSTQVSGTLAAKRRRRVGLLMVGFFVLQLLTWVATPDWGTRLAILVASLFAVPVVMVMTS